MTSMRKVATAATVGTLIEWYDFFVYLPAAALVFNKLFFPQAEPLTGTLLAFGTYATGFLARPLGAIVAGHYGDRVGRKALLIVTLLVMGISTFLIGLLPTYDQRRCRGADPAAGAAHRAGLRHRRRMGRRGADGG